MYFFSLSLLYINYGIVPFELKILNKLLKLRIVFKKFSTVFKKLNFLILFSNLNFQNIFRPLKIPKNHFDSKTNTIEEFKDKFDTHKAQ